jgi:hypothetical protein
VLWILKAKPRPKLPPPVTDVEGQRETESDQGEAQKVAQDQQSKTTTAVAAWWWLQRDSESKDEHK